MEQKSSEISLDADVPLSADVPPDAAPSPDQRALAVGIVYNLKKGLASAVPDAEAEYDNIETVYAIQAALAASGHHVVLLEADEALPEKLRQSHLDLAFNIAEGRNGRGREAQIPAMLNFFGIPFTGSDETTLCLALDKALTKRLLSTYRIRTPKYALLSPLPAPTLFPSPFSSFPAAAPSLSPSSSPYSSPYLSPSSPLAPTPYLSSSPSSSFRGSRPAQISLRYPVIVKPNAEGSSKGISDLSVVKSAKELRALAGRNLALYKDAMLAEEYIAGREFTVGLLGNGDETKVFPPMEIVYKKETQENFHVYSYNVKQNYKEYVSYQCPAPLTKEQETEMMGLAQNIYHILACRDFSRIDFRMEASGKIYFIEINPLPGLAPGYSDYPIAAEFCGINYTALINGILNVAVKRLKIGNRGEVP